MAKGIAAADMGNELATKTVRFRGHTYVVTELSMKAYDKTVKQATEVDEDTKAETFDSQAHNKILLAQCVAENGEKIDVEELYGRGSRVVRALQKVVGALHFDDEPEEDIEDADEGEAIAEAK